MMNERRRLQMRMNEEQEEGRAFMTCFLRAWPFFVAKITVVGTKTSGHELWPTP